MDLLSFISYTKIIIEVLVVYFSVIGNAVDLYKLHFSQDLFREPRLRQLSNNFIINVCCADRCGSENRI